MAQKAKPAKGGGSGKGSTSQSFILFLLGVFAIAGIWVYGITGLIIGVIGIRYAKKNSKAASSGVGQTGKALAITAVILSVIYLIAFAIKMIA